MLRGRFSGHVYAQSLSGVWLFEIPWTVAHQAPLSIEFCRQKYWNGLPFPSPFLGIGQHKLDFARLFPDDPSRCILFCVWYPLPCFLTNSWCFQMRLFPPMGKRVCESYIFSTVWTCFHMFVDQLIFLVYELSLQFHCPFFYATFFFLMVHKGSHCILNTIQMQLIN